MSCKGILPQTRNGSGQIEDERKKELASSVSYCKNGEFSLAASGAILPDNNQDVAEDGINGENISSGVLEIAASNFALPDISSSSEITSDVGVSVDDWFKTRSEGMDLDSVLITDGIGVNDLEGYHFIPSKDSVDMCIVTNICDMGLGFDLPVNLCDKNNQVLSECDNECEPTSYLDDFNNSEIGDRNLLSKEDNSEVNEENNLLGSDNKEVKYSYILQSQDKEVSGISGKSVTWSGSENVYMKTHPLILSGDNMKWEAQSTVSQQSTDYESEKDDFPELSLLTFQVDNAEGINVLNTLSQMDCVSENNAVPANLIVSDSSVVSNSVSFVSSSEVNKPIVGITKPRVIRGNRSLGVRKGETVVKNSVSQSNGHFSEDSVLSNKINSTNVINSSASNQNSVLNPRSLLRPPSKPSPPKSAIEADSLVKKVSETCNLLPTAVTSETENVVRLGSPAKKAPAMTIIAISTDKSKNTTEIVINTSQGEQKFKGKTSDFIKATSKLFNNQPLKAKIGQSLTLSNAEVVQVESSVQQNENEVDWSKYDKSKTAADEQPITEALATLGIDLSSVNYVTAGGNSGYKLWECPTPNCNKLYPRLSLLKVHILTHYGVRPYKCDIPGCQWTFYTFFKLKRHKETHLKRKAFVCPVPSCGHRFTTIYNLKTHRKLHERPAKLQCPVVGCDAHFQTKRAVELHVKKHGISHAPYQCTFAGCGKRYYSSNTLNIHARSHQHREEEVRCQWPDCGKWFDKPCRLKAHMRTHTGDKPYLCTYENCGWAFSSASKLKRHQQKHTNERKFRCSMEGCGKLFMRSEHLKEHVQRHAGERSYQCTVENCGVKFTAKSSLYVHLKKHKQQAKKDADVAMETRPVSKIQPADNAVTSSSSTTAVVASTPGLQQQMQQSQQSLPQKKTIGSSAPAVHSTTPKAVTSGVGMPVQVVMPITATSNSFYCPVESCPKSYSCKASLRQHLLKHHTPVLASNANQLDYITSLLLSGGSNQQVVVSSTDEQNGTQTDNLTTIAAVQGPVCTVAVSDVGSIDSSGLLSTGTLFDSSATYPSEYINTDLLNSHLNNMLLVSQQQQTAEVSQAGVTSSLLGSNRNPSQPAITDADAELHLATESITDPLLVDRNFQPTQRVVAFDLPELESEEEQVPDDPTCRAARTNLTFQDVVQRKRPQQSIPAVSPSKAISSACSSSSVSAGSLGFNGRGPMAGTIAGLRDPVAALRLPPDMAGLLAPTTDLNLLLQEDSGLQVLLLDGSESQAYAESTINLRDLE